MVCIGIVLDERDGFCSRKTPVAQIFQRVGVFVVNAPDAAFGHRDWHAGLLEDRIARSPIDNQHIFPCRYECAVLFRRDNPLFFEMGLERVFFRTLPTVLWLAASTI